MTYVDMHATDLVEISGITRVLLVYTCQQAVCPQGHVLTLRLPFISLDTLNPVKSGSSSSSKNNDAAHKLCQPYFKVSLSNLAQTFAAIHIAPLSRHVSNSTLSLILGDTRFLLAVLPPRGCPAGLLT
jgi:hypothetical protein